MKFIQRLLNGAAKCLDKMTAMAVTFDTHRVGAFLVIILIFIICLAGVEGLRFYAMT